MQSCFFFLSLQCNSKYIYVEKMKMKIKKQSRKKKLKHKHTHCMCRVAVERSRRNYVTMHIFEVKVSTQEMIRAHPLCTDYSYDGFTPCQQSHKTATVSTTTFFFSLHFIFSPATWARWRAVSRRHLSRCVAFFGVFASNLVWVFFCVHCLLWLNLWKFLCWIDLLISDKQTRAENDEWQYNRHSFDKIKGKYKAKLNRI